LAHQPVNTLKKGAELKQFFLLHQVEDRTAKDGRRFLDLLLGDKTGKIKAKVWDDILKKYPGPFVVGDFVGVKGQVDSYKQELQINVKYLETEKSIRFRGGDLSAFDPELLIQATPHDRQELWQELHGLAETGIKPPLKDLVLALLDRHQTDIQASPGAQLYHHPYLGGLLEHTWSVARHAWQCRSVYPELNHDLVLAGAILHDLGKIRELANPQAPQRTPRGHLLGHIVLGWEMVRQEAQALGFDPDDHLLLQLEHIILSHHGAEEFGSPVVPKTREALLVYYLDEIDSKLKMMDQHLETDNLPGEFTSHHKVLRRVLYRGGEHPGADSPPAEESEN